MKQPEPDDSRAARQALGQALRAMHQRSGRTLRAVERDVSVSDSTLSRYFRGQAVPPWPTVERICEALGGDPGPVRRLWAAAATEKSGTPPDAATPVESAERSRPASRLAERLSAVAADRRVWLAAGVLLGLAAGLPLGARIQGGPLGGTATVSADAPVPAPAPSASGTSCPWKYTVTDGDYDDVLVFDTYTRDSIIARYAPRQVFFAPYPPVVVHHMMRTADGWVAQGDWLRRYTATPCHRGSP